MSLLDLDLPPKVLVEAWSELVEWTIWLRETFPSVNDALVDCWPRHSDLILDLLALKEWRCWVYSPPEVGGKAVPERRSRGEMADIWRDHLEQAAERWKYGLKGCRTGSCSRIATSARSADSRARTREIADSAILDLGKLAPPQEVAPPTLAPKASSSEGVTNE